MTDDSEETPKASASRRELLEGLGLAGLFAAVPTASEAKPRLHRPQAPAFDAALRQHVKTVVVIFAENRSFNNLFAGFPGLQQPLDKVPADRFRQRDRDGRILDTLPKIWGGLVKDEQVVNHQTYHVAEDAVTGLPNAPFALKTPEGDPLPQGVVTRDLVHAFYQNQMQINGGKNDGFVAWGDTGAMVMGHYGDNNVNLRLWRIARDYTLCDNFFMGAFGGSFLNHQYLVACTPPTYPDADKSPARSLIADLDGDPKGYRLNPVADMKPSAMDGPARFGASALSPDFRAVNTMRPPYAPTSTRDAANPLYGDRNNAGTLPPQTHATIVDRLSDKGIDWAWYAGGWDLALSPPASSDQFPARPNFQDHHQPLNYFKRFAPGTEDREMHLRDAGTDETPRTNRFMADIAAGKLPAVSYYKPQGNLNMHAGYSDIDSGDRHIATVIEALKAGPQWDNMVVIVTFDENGGWWDHVAPPRGDRWGPGTRVPAIVVSPFAKKNHVEHTVYDTGSIARFLRRRFDLETLPGLTEREDAMQRAMGFKPGDLTETLTFG
ncbi:acid phosphatase [Asticcacaulis solisilvae]|uniref:acid phosphatase n=1 Tax=Asticcacaulis solisilvae TaxID=1217274 RepID=UPI003FD76332